MPPRMSRMSLRREVATKPFSSALSPAMKREFFHAPKYSDIVGVGQRLGEGHLAVAVKVGLDALGLELRLGAEDGGLDQREEVARLLELLAGLRGQAERHGALRVRGVGAGV